MSRFITGDGFRAPSFIENGNYTLNTDSPQAQGLVRWIPTGGSSKLTPEQRVKTGGVSTLIQKSSTLNNVDTRFGIRGLDFVSSDSDYLSYKYSSNPIAMPHTHLIWLKGGDSGSNKFYTGVGQDISNVTTINSGGSNTLRAYRRIAAIFYFSGTLAVSATEWHLCAGLFSTALSRLWVDGVNSTDNTTSSANLSANQIIVGARTNFSNNSNMQFFDFRVYEGLLSEAVLYHAFKPESRWDLYHELGRVSTFIVPAAIVTILPQMMHQLGA